MSRFSTPLFVAHMSDFLGGDNPSKIIFEHSSVIVLSLRARIEQCPGNMVKIWISDGEQNTMMILPGDTKVEAYKSSDEIYYVVKL